MTPESRGSYREVINLAYPAVLTMLSWTAMWTVDTIFVGRVGTAEQGAVGFAGTLLWTAMCLVTGTITAVQIFVAQHCGAGRKDRCGEILWQGIYLGLFASVPIGVLGLFSGPAVRVLDVSPDLVAFAASYMKIRLLGAVFTFLYRAMEVFLQGTGDTRTPLKVGVFCNACNVLLDYLLIFGKGGAPEMGVAGAALATVIATAIQAGVYAYLLIGREGRRVFFPRRVSPLVPRSFFKLVRVGGPIGVQWLLDMGTWTIFTTTVARLGEIQAAAHQIAITILHVSFMPGYGVSIATTTLVGQYLGAGDKAAAKRSAYNSLRIVIGFMGTMGVVFYLFRTDLIRLFNPDPQVIAVGSTLLIYAAVFQMFDGTGMVSAGILRGAGDTRWPSAVSIGIAWGVFVPMVYLMIIRLKLGVTGGWQAAAVWIVVLGVTLFAGVRKRGWAERRLLHGGADAGEGAPILSGPDAMTPAPPAAGRPDAEPA
jgi:MATE family multidrug resistance protein